MPNKSDEEGKGFSDKGEIQEVRLHGSQLWVLLNH